MKLVVVSNGYGEDRIGAQLVGALREFRSDIDVLAVPLVGTGEFYKQNQIPVAIQNKSFPSGGFIRGISVLLKDIQAGLLGQIWAQFKVLRRVCKDVDAVLCLGDVYCLSLVALTETKSKLYFFQTAKSDRFMPHGAFEKMIIRRNAAQVFTRDEVTADALKASKINAHFLGNPMIDLAKPSGALSDWCKDSPVIGIFPGSREEGYENFRYCLRVLDEVAYQLPRFKVLVARPPQLDAEVLNASLRDARFTDYRKGEIELRLVDEFSEVINQSHLILGLAGTANEQAVYCGVPVICFEGFGPQSSVKRFNEQAKLLGDGLHHVPRSIAGIAHEVCVMLKKGKPRLKWDHEPTAPQVAGAILKDLV